ncbi:hypothetical protein A2926_04495 [Candidatus Giovannonibacteria bacterium RIFCSPLOWO2_01_FULL_44_40]|nr:MAG: hypothetical protein A3C77_01865 [Candidatus Giovannonibacteria bacterium RIFCSPHIGHO2_02_FULL_45_13]OGF80095.1 MAG: hypothetical protein A2926_04495 [Candidatus Giovannonibacteria bacterium RIFCSPLOWO2_01_FULL_44_40]
MPRIKINSGYSLLEIVIYVGILAIIAVLVVGSTLSIYRAFAKTRVERKLIANGDVALETMIRGIRSATSSNAAVSVFGSSPGVLQINAENSTEKFSLSGTILQIKRGGDAAGNLTSPDVSVTSLIFYSTSTDDSTMIRTQFTLEAGSGIFKKTKSFYGSAVMRGRY